MVAVPLLAPAVAVFTPTFRLVLLVACGASSVNEPPAVTPAVAPPMLALSFSEKPSLAAGLESVRFWLVAAPTRSLPKFTGSGVCRLGCASRNT